MNIINCSFHILSFMLLPSFHINIYNIRPTFLSQFLWPYAVQTAGVQVNRYRYIAMIAAGSIAGLAGSYLSISDVYKRQSYRSPFHPPGRCLAC